MKTAIIYSGKGGVGKTTTTANIARVLAHKGKKVFIIDADINTPSMNVEFKGETPEPNITVHSTGNMFGSFFYLEKSMITDFIKMANEKINNGKYDYILIDTPPSITPIHMELLKNIDISTIIFVSQPQALSRSDVQRTASFFKKECSADKIVMVENMCTDDSEEFDYGIPVVAHIPFINNFDTTALSKTAADQYKQIISYIDMSNDTFVKENTPVLPYDESYDVKTIIYNKHRYSAKSGYLLDIQYDDGHTQQLFMPQLKFLSLRTWDRIRDHIFDMYGADQRLQNCDTKIVGRLLDAFKNKSQAYFMVTNAPACCIHLLPGEIGQATLDTTSDSYYGLPRIKYQTKDGEITLFPDEVKPVDMNLITLMIQDGYSILTDGRYIPPKEQLEEIYNIFGARVGLTAGWEEIYDYWTK